MYILRIVDGTLMTDLLPTNTSPNAKLITIMKVEAFAGSRCSYHQDIGDRINSQSILARFSLDNWLRIRTMTE
jgi:hypothetical protein